MIWPFQHKEQFSYWLRVFAIYALTEAGIQLMFLIVLNNFGDQRTSIVELHLIMLIFQCLLIWPIWWVARSVYYKPIFIQVIVNLAFYILYSYCWFGPVQNLIGYLYDHLQSFTRAVNDRQAAILDDGNEYSYLNYQLLKHSFRLSVFFAAAYFFNYRTEEKKRLTLAIANKELQLKLLKWQLNPSFYFKTVAHLGKIANNKPENATAPILQLAKVMEHVIYETRETLIDVKKEISFLNSYTQLLNQHNDHTIIETEVEGDYSRLKISPLLLADFIDKFVTAVDEPERICCLIRLSFVYRTMTLSLIKRSGKPDLLRMSNNNELHQRLEESYSGKFSFEYPGNGMLVKLSIILDEEEQS